MILKLLYKETMTITVSGSKFCYLSVVSRST